MSHADPTNPLIAKLSRFNSVVLFANSTTADPASYAANPDPNRLHVFFGPVWKILGKRFDQPSLLCQPMRKHNALIQSRENRHTARQLLDGDGLIGSVAVRGGKHHRGPSEAEPQTQRPEGADFVIDGRLLARGWYTQGRAPSTGFLMALWFLENCPDMQVTLDGFSGLPDGSNKMLNSHDWLLEQSVLEIERRAGRLVRRPEPLATTAEALRQRYSDLDEGTIVAIVQGRMEVSVRSATALAAKAAYRKSPAAHWRKLGARLRATLSGRSTERE